MSSNTHYFHFTLGPVQGFVAQARRTRDFWAGSFILSWLAAVAIKAVEHQGGKIEFPKADKNYMAWLVGEGKEGTEPKQGSIPNRFKSMIAAIDPQTFQPKHVTAAVQEAWKALAEEVWKADLQEHSNGVQRNIWDRQISNFWEMSWVITEDKNDSSALDKRKNWRTYAPPEEPGVKCAMMDGWQELSGTLTPNREEMNRFWDAVRNSGKLGMKSDLRKNEALCAIAFVKRRFSRHFKQLDHNMKQGWRLKGWEVPSAVPSVTYMAAVHWLEKALNTADKLTLNTFFTQAQILTGEYGEWHTQIKCLTEAWGEREWKALDGNVFFESALENPNLFEDQKQAEKVRKALNAVRNSTNPVLPQPTPFYAIVLMDGDSLGVHMSDVSKQHAITAGLEEFTKGVPQIIYDHNGFLIYAGGDDVLAILPLEDAIPCAAALRKHYLSCFEKQPEKILTTLSGAIEFVHIKTPLTKALQDAHHLLDEVAKDGRGRDALAIRVWKPGGLQLEWAQPWEIALIPDPETNQTYIEKIAADFQQVSATDGQFSNKFFYKIRERFALLNPNHDDAPSVLSEDQALSVMAMEYLNSGKSDLNGIKNTQERINKAKDRIRPLLEQCRPVIRDKDEPDRNQWKRSPRLEADGALLVRFLAQKGVEA